MATWVKFCGCTCWDDVATSVEAGADAFGMIFAPSPRRIEWEAAREIARRVESLPIEPVAVFVDPSDDEIAAVAELFGRARIQFSGTEPAHVVTKYGPGAIKAIHVEARPQPAQLADACSSYGDAWILFDAKAERSAGGTGTTFPWASVVAVSKERRTIVAGGLTPQNVGQCVRMVRPYGVDVRSGIETGGRKDRRKMLDFVRAVRDADEA